MPTRHLSVVRWMPGSLFTWRDKNGLQRKVLDKENLAWDEDLTKHCLDFSLQEKKVFWRKGPACKQEELSDSILNSSTPSVMLSPSIRIRFIPSSKQSLVTASWRS